MSGRFRKVVQGIYALLLISHFSALSVGQTFEYDAGVVNFSDSFNDSDSCSACFPNGLSLDFGALDHGSNLSSFFGIEGHKQPDDFGANANLGVRGRFNFGTALLPNAGVGLQIGGAVSVSGNAVQVFELLGESTDQVRAYSTVGVFKRRPTGLSWGAVYDFQHQDSFDRFDLTQFRFRSGWSFSPVNEIGVNLTFADRSDRGRFNSQEVELEPIEQLNLFWWHQWPTTASTTLWVGVADGHSEENVITGTLPAKQNQILFGADLHAPLNGWLALYGETNLLMPADTGSVTAFLGFEMTPRGKQRNNRQAYRPYLPVASSTTFTNDLNRR